MFGLSVQNRLTCSDAYGAQYRPREAYRFAAETTVYVKESQRGRGLGTKLYNALLVSLKSRGVRRAYAGIALPNDASRAIHRSCGFTEIGVFPEAGFKFDRWHDVSWWQRKI
ncbi:MAG: N-acetyltransferase family protein [Granulosicoccus sp.]